MPPEVAILDLAVELLLVAIWYLGGFLPELFQSSTGDIVNYDDDENDENDEDYGDNEEEEHDEDNAPPAKGPKSAGNKKAVALRLN
ncbi:GD24996 [Drosophila simulans]|uniref:GD24996 n=1 Tax=Drosophila simulans TaxID=7240 RepID=B4QBE2_DROSI|nr:GD24996 [Drosophila simulans]